MISKPTALIAGASSGIGEALAHEFAQAGYSLALVARNEEKLRQLSAELSNRYNVTVRVFRADLESNDGAAKLAAEVKGQGISIHTLVNNAGVGTFGEFKDVDIAPQLGMMQLNMTSLVELTHAFLPDVIKSKGKILNTASTAAFQPGPYMAVYYATKAFVLSFSEAIGAELEASGVTVTALCPGPTSSGFQDQAQMHDSALVKGKKLPSAADVAKAGFVALQAGKPVYIPGSQNGMLAQSIRFTPRRVVLKLVKALSRPV